MNIRSAIIIFFGLLQLFAQADTLIYVNGNSISAGVVPELSNGNDFVAYKGAGLLNQGVEGKRLNFDGDNDYFESKLDVGFSGNEFTLSTWVYHQAVVNKIERYISVYWEKGSIRHNRNGHISLHFNNANGTVILNSTKAVLTPKRWHHVAGTWDGSYLRLFFNGELIDSLASSEIFPHTVAKKVKLSSDLEPLNGSMDEVLIMDRAMTSKEVKGLYDEHRDSFAPYPVFNGTENVLVDIIATDPPYNLDPSGSVDATQALQNALNNVASRGGGIVYLPAGEYRFDGHLFMKINTTLMGYWEHPANDGVGKGTILKLYENKGNELGEPFIETALVNNCGIKNLTFWYPEQQFDNPQPYPYTFASRVSSIVENVTFVNSYNGMILREGSACAVNNVYGCVLNRGLFCPYSASFSFVHDLYFSPKYWQLFGRSGAPQSTGDVTTLSNFLRSNLIATEVGAMEGFMMHNVHAPVSKLAVYFNKDKDLLAAEAPLRNDDIIGYGGQIGKITGKIDWSHWAYWWHGEAVPNIDNIPFLKNIDYLPPSIPEVKKHSKKDVFNVASFGALGDSINDDTWAIKKAINAARKNGGGIVYFPKGKYVVTQNLVVPSGVELRSTLGKSIARTLTTHWLGKPILLCKVGHNSPNPDTDSAFISLEARSGIRGLNIHYPDQPGPSDANGTGVVKYPYAIRSLGAATWVMNLNVSNAYYLMDFASAKSDGFFISDIIAFGLQKGINIGGGTNTGHVQYTDLSFGAVANDPLSPINEYCSQHTTHVLLGDCANIRLFQIGTFRSYIGMHFYEQNGKGPVNTSVWYPYLDVEQEAAIKLEAGDNINIFGLYTTGGDTRHTNGASRTDNWIESTPSFNGKISIYGMANEWQFTEAPLEQLFLGGTLNLVRERSLTYKKSVSGASVGSNVVANCVDSDPNTYWEAVAGSELIVDLGSIKEVKRFALLNAGLYNFSKDYNTVNIELYGSTDGVNYTKFSGPTSNFGWLKVFDNPNKRVEWDAPLIAQNVRYVKLKVLKGTQTGLDQRIRIREFDLFGIQEQKDRFPTTISDLMKIDEDMDGVVDVQSNDNDIEGLMTTRIVDQPKNGVASVVDEDSIYYKPNKDFYGTDTIVYEVCDFLSQCSNDTVFISVNNINDAPVAKEDFVVLNEDNSITINVQLNDNDVDGDMLTTTILQQGSNGSGIVLKNDSIEYVPGGNFFGKDTLVYQVCDNQNSCDQDTVFLTINPINDKPFAVPDTVSTLMNEKVKLNPLLNDYDIEQDSLTLTVLSGPFNGTVKTSGDTVTYFPAIGFHGKDSIEYSICDDGQPKMCDTAYIKILIKNITGQYDLQELDYSSLKKYNGPYSLFSTMGMLLEKGERFDFRSTKQNYPGGIYFLYYSINGVENSTRLMIINN